MWVAENTVSTLFNHRRIPLLYFGRVELLAKKRGLNMENQISRSQAVALCALRVSLGMLLVWWGLARIVKPAMGVGVQKKFYLGFFDSVDLQYVFGFIEVGVGLLIVVGLWRRYAVPLQLMITGFSATMIWSALLDPFALWLPVEKVAGFQHLFYPTVIGLCAAMVIVVFREHDRFNLDSYLASRAKRSEPSVVPAE